MRRLPFLLVLILLLALPLQTLHARYRRPDLVNVPVERLVKNLEEIAAKDKKNAQARLNLARAHAMAYAQRTDTLEALREEPERGAWFGYEPEHVPFQVQETEDADKLQAAKGHLAAAIKEYEAAAKLDPKNLTIALGHAWCLEQAGEKEQAIKAYRAVIESAWKQEKDLEQAGLGWHSVTAEAGRYLTALLDKEQDQKEIATIAARTKQMEQVSRPVTPIVIPLKDGLTARDLEDRTASVLFDVDGSGLPQRWTWISRDAGWLVYDPQHTGQVKSGLQLFGNVTFWMFWENGYDALAALDDNGDGSLNSKELQGLAIWQDANSNGRCDPGEVQSLEKHGIVSLSVRHQRDKSHADNIAWSPHGVTLRDGSQRATYDIVLQPR